MKGKSQIVSELDEILKECETYIPSAQASVNFIVASEIITKIKAATFRYTFVNDPYRQELAAIDTKFHDFSPGSHQGTNYRAFAYLGLLKALKSDIEKGYITNLFELIHADSFADMLHITNELLKVKLKDPAAVVIGTSLELHIKNLCKKHKIPLLNKNNKLKNANTLTADLYTNKIIKSIDHKQIIAWQAIRNDAAHGQYSNYSIDQVENMKTGIIDFIKKYPA